MLNRVLEVVAEEGWFDLKTPFEKSIYMTHGAGVSLVLSRNGRPDLYVKFAQLVSYETLAQRSRAAATHYADLVPRFVGYARRPPLEVLATESIEFRAIGTEALHSHRDMKLVQEGLTRFFDASRRIRVEAVDRFAWLDDFEAYFRNSRYGKPAAACGERMRDVMRFVEAVPQHGDLVTNNFGLAAGRRVVIFDWEDFGAVSLPGLDLFTLLLSLDQDRRRVPRAGRRQFDVDALLVPIGLSDRLFRELSLSYALVFRYLKRNYSAEARARLDRVIDGFLTHRVRGP